MIEFLWLWAWLIVPLPWLLRWLLPAADSRQQAIRAPFYSRLKILVNQEKHSAFTGGHLLTRITMICIWLCLVAAAARPLWVGDAVELPTSGRDLMLAVDISGSMKMEDMNLRGNSATRLDVVKSVVSDFVQQRKGDRLGLILFGSQAYLQTPLTFDRHSLAVQLQEAQIGFAGEKTAIGDALGLAVKRLRDRPEGNRVLILLTDGANTAGEVEPLKASELAQQLGIRVHTIGVGATEMIVPGFFGDRRINPSSELDEEMLKSIASVTGGRYFRATDTASLQQIYQLLDQIEAIEQKAESYRPQRALYPWPLGIGLVLALMLWLSRYLARANWRRIHV